MVGEGRVHLELPPAIAAAAASYDIFCNNEYGEWELNKLLAVNALLAPPPMLVVE